ncbi:MAG: DUF2779 domain-containing protein, partial [Candidatus Dojkabacteria bacterium]|nr:DUF2779 domain-containing protein [Candidatus Dojkabacteria bacterium]
MITKTDFLTYLDSPRHLWAVKHNKIDKKDIDVYLKHLLEQGYEVEELAVDYIKKYILPKYSTNKDDLHIQATQVDGIYEARVDVLIRNEHTDKWDMYEIKSSSKVDNKHRYDATFQYLVFDKVYDIDNIYILHLNGDYEKEGEISLPDLFTIENINSDVNNLKNEVLDLRLDAFKISESNDVDETLACIRPKQCPCPSLCHPNLPEYSIYDINRITQNEGKVRDLEALGIIDIYDIPEDFELSDIQRKQVNVAQSEEAYIDKEEIEAMFDDLEYPLYFLDYETFNPAIPLFNGYRTFDHITFQYSLHVLDNDGNLTHYEYLHTDMTDPIPSLLSSLKEHIKDDDGSIVVWNKSFEGTRNKRMGEIYPEFEDFCEDMNDRLFDLMDVFKDQKYDDPKFKGSYSIKSVLPVLVPELSYKNLNVQNGAMAMASWYDYVFKDGKSKNIENDLL